MLTTHAVGIDLGTTYSCIAYLNEHGEPVTLANAEGELCTPSVVLFDDDEVIVGTEALRNAIVRPDRVVQNAKRFMGDPEHRWAIAGRFYTPVDIATFVLKKLIAGAQQQIGPIERAVITVPAQFSEAQRHATVEAGHRAGFEQVDIINEPVAAALCYVLGTEGLWFTELAGEQRIMVYDLGGGTFDLSLVKYQKNEVSVMCGAGDLNLGGIDWNLALQNAIAEQFSREYGADPRTDPQSLQFLALEVEQAKRSLSVRPRAALTVQHAGQRKTYQIELEQFEKLSRRLVDQTSQITQKMLKDRKMGWAHVDVVLTTGGSSRMPMIRHMLKKLSGRTLNTSLSPEQSIAHGATYYAGMLLTNSKFARSILTEQASARLRQVRQQSINARALGILIRDMETRQRVPHYLIPDHTPLPAAKTQTFGTVVPNQHRVHLQIIESGTSPGQPHVKIGECVINNLPPNLPEGSEIDVTIRYDEQARVHVDARDVTSGAKASTEIIRQENVVQQLQSDKSENTDAAVVRARTLPQGTQPVDLITPAVVRARSVPQRPAAAQQSAREPAEDPSTVDPAAPRPAPRPRDVPQPRSAPQPRPAPVPPQPVPRANPAAKKPALDSANEPVPLCNRCGEPLDFRGECPACGASPSAERTPAGNAARQPRRVAGDKPRVRASRPATAAAPKPAGPKPERPRQLPVPPPMSDDEILELDDNALDRPAAPGGHAKGPKGSPAGRSQRQPGPRSQPQPRPRRSRPAGEGEDEFWQIAE